ncbi:hypothetical protein [Methylotenera sp.]|uniref:hypothetical protein n=1 Tax=Methylotenera sp. TaxID=2051956 RepID=UPI0027194F33|nr:hypothetical protein [Methylotenera sp.]MDO9205636.1 hypothetical protein [Methylotenera sp.]
MSNNKQILGHLCLMLVLGLSACAHQSKIQPSKGHIDGENTVTPQSTKPSATDNASISPAAASGIPKPVVNNTYLPHPNPKPRRSFTVSLFTIRL